VALTLNKFGHPCYRRAVPHIRVKLMHLGFEHQSWVTLKGKVRECVEKAKTTLVVVARDGVSKD
jgi:hypothetical protein